MFCLVGSRRLELSDLQNPDFVSLVYGSVCGDKCILVLWVNAVLGSVGVAIL